MGPPENEDAERYLIYTPDGERNQADVGSDSFKDRLRSCFLSRGCGLFALGFNVLLAISNTGLIVFDLWLITQKNGEGAYQLFFFIADAVIVSVLLAEISGRWLVVYHADCGKYLDQLENKFDLAVGLFSSLFLALYAFDDFLKSDAETFLLAMRVLRDVLRVARTIYFIHAVIRDIDFSSTHLPPANDSIDDSDLVAHFAAASGEHRDYNSIGRVSSGPTPLRL